LTAEKVLNSEKELCLVQLLVVTILVGLSVSPSVINSNSDMIIYLLVGLFNKYNKIDNLTPTFLAIWFNIIIPPKHTLLNSIFRRGL
jgi:hypothetical protein